MKKIFLFSIFLFLFNIIFSQKLEPFNGSYKKKYEIEKPEIKYEYLRKKQVHNYSGNWDFDGDNIKDQLYFIGNGGAHLYFYLKIILSSNKKKHDFNFILLDRPVLVDLIKLEKENLKNFTTEFIIHDFNSDGLNDIYVNFDDTFSSIPCKWKRKGISSRHIVLNFNKGKLKIKNYAP